MATNSRYDAKGIDLNSDTTRQPNKMNQTFNWCKARFVFLPTLFWNAILGRWLKVRQWWNPVLDDVILGAFPFSKDVPELAKLGVTGVVNTCEEYSGPQTAYAANHIEQFRMPTIDFTHPKIDDVESAVQFMNRKIADGGKVYVHCKAGRGRSATVVLCWLIDQHNETPESGQALLLKARPHVNQHLAQRPVVIEFWRRRQESKNEPT